MEHELGVLAHYPSNLNSIVTNGIPSLSYSFTSWNIRVKSVIEARQCKVTYKRRQLFFLEKKELPQVGPELTTSCIPCRCSTSWATEAAQLGRPNLLTSSKGKGVSLLINRVTPFTCICTCTLGGHKHHSPLLLKLPNAHVHVGCHYQSMPCITSAECGGKWETVAIGHKEKEVKSRSLIISPAQSDSLLLKVHTCTCTWSSSKGSCVLPTRHTPNAHNYTPTQLTFWAFSQLHTYLHVERVDYPVFICTNMATQYNIQPTSTYRPTWEWTIGESYFLYTFQRWVGFLHP